MPLNRDKREPGYNRKSAADAALAEVFATYWQKQRGELKELLAKETFPAVKHAQHNQLSHGNWARGAVAGEFKPIPYDADLLELKDQLGNWEGPRLAMALNTLHDVDTGAVSGLYDEDELVGLSLTMGDAADSGDELLGILWDDDPKEIVAQNPNFQLTGGGYDEVVTLATKRPGYGRRMMQEAVNYAATRSNGLYLTSSVEARGFYDKIGMHEITWDEIPTNSYYFTPAEIQVLKTTKAVAMVSAEDEPQDGVFTQRRTTLSDFKVIKANFLNVFWSQAKRELFAIILPHIVAGASGGVEITAGEIEELGGLGVDWALPNSDAMDWALAQADATATDITNTRSQAFTQRLARWIETPGQTLGMLIDDFYAIYGSYSRALAAATHEITRAYAQGNLAAYREMQKQFPEVLHEMGWFTNEDELVCPICGGILKATPWVPVDGRFLGDIEAPPAHYGCRCWTGYRVVLPTKHLAGQHEQSSHGNWARGGVGGASINEKYNASTLDKFRHGTTQKDILEKMTPEERAIHQAHLDRLVAEADIYVAMPPGAFKALLKGEESKTVSEIGKTKASAGATAKYMDMRSDFEHDVFGDHPSYGYLSSTGLSSRVSMSYPERGAAYPADGAFQYGNIRVQLNPDVRERTTFTDGDSLDAFYYQNKAGYLPGLPSGVNEPQLETLGLGRMNYTYVSRIRDKTRTTTGGSQFLSSATLEQNTTIGYFEAQVHGDGIRLGDVARVITVSKPLSQRNLKQLETLGIPYEHVDLQGILDTQPERP